MAAPTDPPVTRVQVATRNADEAAELIRQLYIDHRPRFAASQPPPEFRISSTSIGALRVDRTRSSFRFTAELEPFDYLCGAQILGGRTLVDDGSDEIRLRPRDGFLHRIGTSEHAELADLDIAFLCLPLARVAQFAAEHTAIDADDLRFDAMIPVSAAMGGHWANTVAYVHRMLLDPGAPPLPALMVEQLINTAAAAALAVFPNTSMSTDRRPVVGYVPSAALRRAVAFIDARAGDPITLSDIAAAAGITPRALQNGFARHHGSTPMAYLRRVRLEGAHRALQAADPSRGDSVAAIAARWGFSHPGRFATLYRRVFGRPPSHTLRT